MKIENCKSRIQNKRGFSFMEVMVVIAIIGIMSAVSLVSLSGSREKKEVETAAREVVAAMRETQNNALTGKQPDVAKFPCNYKFNSTLNSNTYTINYNYHPSGTDCGTPTENSPALGSYTLKNGVQFQAANEVSFSVPFATTSSRTFIIYKGSTTYVICVTSAGKISENVGNTCL